jgi:hypothetical protein
MIGRRKLPRVNSGCALDSINPAERKMIPSPRFKTIWGMASGMEAALRMMSAG